MTGLEAQATGLPCLVSDTVSDEFVYTDQVSFFSLQDPIDKVCHLIKQIKIILLPFRERAVKRNCFPVHFQIKAQENS